MLVPSMLRNALPDMLIAFFLHIPFPAAEIFRMLPQREEILHGVLASDLIGFHIYEYKRYAHSTSTEPTLTVVGTGTSRQLAPGCWV